MSTSGRKSGIPLLVVKISTGDRAVIERFAEFFESRGEVKPVKSGSRMARARRQMWRWEATGNNAQAFLREIEPYLVGKRDLAQLALKLTFLPFGGGKRQLPQEEIALRKEVNMQMVAINNRVTIGQLN